MKRDLSKQTTASIPAYTNHVPQEEWTERPWAVTHVRNDLVCENIRLDHDFGGAAQCGHRDMVIVKVKEANGGDMYVVNVYNQNYRAEPENRRGQTLSLFQPFVDGKKALIVGDFNMHSHEWDYDVGESSDANDFCDWMGECGAAVLNIPGDSTHNLGGVIDLAIATLQLMMEKVCTTTVVHATSLGIDHYPVYTDISSTELRLKVAPVRFQMGKLDKDAFLEACREVLPTLTLTEGPLTHEMLDDEAVQLIGAVIQALDKATTRAISRKPGKPWWNEICHAAGFSLRQARLAFRADSDDDILYAAMKDARRVFKSTIEKVRKDYWRCKIGEFRNPKDIYRALKWSRYGTRFAMPQLKNSVTNEMATTAEEKVALLLNTHTQPVTASDNGVFAMPHQHGHLFAPVTEEEVRLAVFKPGSTAPGIDGIQNEAWKLSWPVFGPLIHRHVARCLSSGYHPEVYRKSILVAIEKPGKKRNEPSGYRLISLLSTLGKITERIMAKRFASRAVELDIIPRLYAGAVPKRSAEDLTLKLMDEVVDGFSRGQKTTMVTIDVKGAFDAVGKRRMVARLHAQGWSSEMVSWVWHFMTNRTVTMSVDGAGMTTRQVGGSLPQGSPVSPVLFMLFMAPLYKELGMLGYADDGCIRVASRSIPDNIRQVQTILGRAFQWCRSNDLELDWNKTGLLHLYRGRILRVGVDLTLPNGQVIEPEESLRWLGVWWNRTASPTAHVKKAIEKAKKSVAGMRILSGVYHGAPIESLLMAARGCVLPQLMYGVATWAHNIGKGAIDKLETCWRAALRAALPMYRTTPVPVIYHMSSTPHIESIIGDLKRAAGVRASTMPERHPLYDVKPKGVVAKYKSMLPGQVERDLGWYDGEIYGPSTRLIDKLSKEEAVIQHSRLIESMGEHDIRVYTDGSRMDNGKTGAGWVVYEGNRIIIEGNGSCGLLREVADAEAIAALEGIHAAMRHASIFAGNLYLFLDNYSVAERIAEPLRQFGTSQHYIIETRRRLGDWRRKFAILNYQRSDVKLKSFVYWVPGHMGVEGNEAVDQQAKLGCDSDIKLVRNGTVSVAAVNRWRKEELDREFKVRQREAPIRPHLRKKIPPTKAWDRRWLKGLSRTAVGRIATAKSRHGDTQWYHDWLQHEPTRFNCPFCHQPKTTTHPWSCRSNRKRYSDDFVNKLIYSPRGCRYLAGKLEKKWLTWYSPPVNPEED